MITNNTSITIKGSAKGARITSGSITTSSDTTTSQDKSIKIEGDATNVVINGKKIG